MYKQATIEKTVTLSGLGLHTGELTGFFPGAQTLTLSTFPIRPMTPAL